jgi:hypothetical protein
MVTFGIYIFFVALLLIHGHHCNSSQVDQEIDLSIFTVFIKKGSQNVDELLPELVFYLLQKTLSERVN